jgi:hypothetical protein
MQPSKCAFGVQEVEYLGYIIYHEGIKVDLNKIKAMMQWPIPKTLNNLRGFSELMSYYCKFVKNYDQIVAPSTSLLKKDSFCWTQEATRAFEKLKEDMCRTRLSYA